MTTGKTGVQVTAGEKVAMSDEPEAVGEAAQGPTGLTDDEHPWADARGIPVPGVTQPEQSVPDPEAQPLESEVERNKVTAVSDVFTPLKEA
jgi:hypothetical protein